MAIDRASAPGRRWVAPTLAALLTVTAALGSSAATNGNVPADVETASYQPVPAVPAGAGAKPYAGKAVKARKIKPPPNAWLGAFVNPDRSDGRSASRAEVRALEAEMGRKLDIDHRFYEWHVPMLGRREKWDVRKGRIPMVTWGAYDTRAYHTGKVDGWVREQARRMADFGHPIMLRFFHEFDGSYRSGQVHSAADFIKAWRHVHDIFTHEGATNVKWIWCPLAYTFISKKPYPPTFYPGDKYVDWVAADGYNWHPSKPDTKWRSFEQIYAKWYAWAVTTGKPLMAAEFGVFEWRPKDKARWFKDMARTLKTTMPAIKAVVYFDTTIYREGRVYDWRIDSSKSSKRAFVKIANHPWLRPPD